MKKVLTIFLTCIIHLLAIGLIIYSFLPIAKWYFNYRPIWGVDFYNTVSLVKILGDNFTWPPSGWVYSWFAGFPLLSGYPLLHIYLLLPLTRYFDLLFSVQLWSMVTTGLFLIGAYFLFFILSRNFILSAILTIAVAYSGGVYQTLTWAGSIPAFATQAFFPWVLVFVVLYLKRLNLRYLLAAALIAGLSILGHQQIFIAYILPSVTILIFLSFTKMWAIWSKIRTFLIFLLISLLVGLPILSFSLRGGVGVIIGRSYQSGLSTTSVPQDQGKIDIANFNKAQVQRIISDNNDSLFIFLAITGVFFMLALLITRRFYSILQVLPFVTMAAYFAFYIWLFGQGISIFHGGWYRLFWSVPIWIGVVAGAFWGEADHLISEFLRSKILRATLFVCLNLTILVSGFLLLYQAHPMTIGKIIYRSQASSAHPDVLNLRIKKNEQLQLKSKLLPAWIDGDNVNFRLYDGDQTVNLWWNSFYNMPLARGYLDPPSERGFLFWLDAALSETDGQPQLVKSFHYPFETALSNALFLIDWYGIKYYEGGHEGDAFTPFPKYLSNLIAKEEVVDLNSEKYHKRNVFLRFYDIKDEYSLPILTATNAPTLGIFGSDQGYETVVRAIAEKDNINSQKLILLKLGRDVDAYDLKTLKKFDALYLYDDDYKNSEKTVKRLTKFIEEGKKVFIETGVEIKQSSGQLPEIFPVTSNIRKGMGKEWALEILNQTLGKDVDFTKFSPPVFDESEWKISFADESDLRSNAQIILKNHGKIVMASQKIGNGEVIWSGMNFAYHVTRNHNLEEAKLFKNILSQLVNLERKPTPPYQTKFISATKREIESDGAKGILFKEQAFPGWRIQLLGNVKDKNKDLPIFKAGPATPGFIYVALPDSGKVKVRFSFGGATRDKILTLASVLIAVVITEEVILGGLTIGKLRKILWLKLKKKLRFWWEKEDEE